MAGIDNNIGRTNRLQQNVPTRPGAGKPPEEPPSVPKLTAAPDRQNVGSRPLTEEQRQEAAVAAVKEAQAAKPADQPTDEKPTSKAVAEVVGLADGVREGVRMGSSVDDLRALPIVGKAVQGESRIGNALSWLARSQVGQTVANALKTHRFIAPAARFLGRIAPVAGAVIAGFDIRDALKTQKDPKASGLEKGLAATKGILSTVSAVAGIATLVLAPTGVGAAIAGGIALATGLVSTGADLWLGKLRNDRKDAAKKA